jgi:NAD(P)-dependent dehydrogenase (short-subunit alcohol dehydrogenase family)
MKTVLVTGASGGVGSAAVGRLAELGWRVFAGVRSLEAGEELARKSRAVTPVQLDICDEQSVLAAQDAVTLEAGGGLGALVNNAGLVVMGPVELVPVPVLRRQFEVNVIGHIAVTQAFLPLLRAAGGRVVNVSGAAGSVSLPTLGPISASKAALESLTDALRMELRHQGVPVSIVSPGLLRTQIHQKSEQAAERDGYAGDHDTQRIYAEVLEASRQVMANAREAPVETAVAKIVEALTATRPRPRYVVGRDAKALVALRHVPPRIRDRLLMWNRGLKRELFERSQTAR